MPERRGEWKRWLLLALAVLLAGTFAYLNSAERVSLHFGLFVLFRIPLAVLLFLVFLLGMGMMFLIGLRHDLRVRRLLREFRIQEERRPWQTETPLDVPLAPFPASPLYSPFEDEGPPRVHSEAPAPVGEEPDRFDGERPDVEEESKREGEG